MNKQNNKFAVTTAPPMIKTQNHYLEKVALCLGKLPILLIWQATGARRLGIECGRSSPVLLAFESRPIVVDLSAVTPQGCMIIRS